MSAREWKPGDVVMVTAPSVKASTIDQLRNELVRKDVYESNERARDREFVDLRSGGGVVADVGVDLVAGEVDDVDVGVAVESRAVRRGGVWMLLDREGYVIDAYAENIRPLVVIDPEDCEQLELLAGALIVHGTLADALRSLLTPPKPDEPTDPKALVTDHRDNIWRLLADGEWVCTSGPDIGEYLTWAGLVERGACVVPEGVFA